MSDQVKKRKFSDIIGDEDPSALRHLGELNVTKVLSKDLRSKTLFLLAKVDQTSSDIRDRVETESQGQAEGECTGYQVRGHGQGQGDGDRDNTQILTFDSAKRIVKDTDLDTRTAAESKGEDIDKGKAKRGGDGDVVQSNQKNAVVLLEKTAFSEESLPLLFSPCASLKRNMQNDIYGVYECCPPSELSGFKTTVIYPATERHIQKYSAQDCHLINETYADYLNITLPYMEEKQLGIQWVFNILDKKAETERLVFEDPDPETGFVMLPDMKWDEAQVSNLYLIVIVHRRGIKSIRDLDASHLPLLRNIQEKCTKCIAEKYGVDADQLRAYIHYQPSYYHFHVHFTHLMFDAPGTNVGRAHLLSSVIENIELLPGYYQQKPLAYVLRDSDELYQRFRDAKVPRDASS